MDKEKLLEELRQRIPEEYIRSCDTSDGIGRYEIDKDSWEYQLHKYVIKLQKENKHFQQIINKAIKYIEKNKETRSHYEPYGTPMGNPNYITTHISGYYNLLEILKGKSE